MAPKTPKSATKADEAAEGEVKVGCSKCRFSASGCNRCRAKAGLDPLSPKKATPAKEKKTPAKTEACKFALRQTALLSHDNFVSVTSLAYAAHRRVGMAIVHLRPFCCLHLPTCQPANLPTCL
jgi:hypothetical protein